MSGYCALIQPLMASAIRKSKRVFDDKKVTDHHAIIPTGVQLNLVAEEWNIYDVICKRFIANFYPDCIVHNTTVIGEANKIKFKATGKEIEDPGWRVVYPKKDNKSNESEDNKDAKKKEEKILPAFTQEEILASIDATQTLGEYIRKEMNWKLFLHNREKIRLYKNLTFKISPTISVLNVLHLPDLYQEALSLNLIAPHDFYINLLEYPAYYNIQILPGDKKEKVMARYNDFYAWCEDNAIPSSIQKSFQDIVNYINQATDHSGKNQARLWIKYLEVTKELDEIRT